MYDYLVIGSGVAGLFTALSAAELTLRTPFSGGAPATRIALVTKARLEESNTRYAQGGIAAAVAPTDSPAAHIEDTLIAGAGLCDRAAVEILCNDAPARIADLLRIGVPFDRAANNDISLGREGAHGANRILHAGGDATGFHIEAALCRAVRACANITIYEETFVDDLTQAGGRVTGAVLRDKSGAAQEVAATFTILASGGAGQLYTYTTNPAVATGDGMAVAYRAGAALSDLEFYQFHPTALAIPGAPTFLVSEAVRGEGATLRAVNADGSAGRAFMLDYDPRGDLASRDVVSRAIASEMAKSGTAYVYLDATHIPAETMRLRFPTIDRFCQDHSLDFTAQPMPVAPAAHYFMGGIVTDTWGATTLPGLYACGEAACTGVHGANRLASNSLLEGLVFGRRIVEGSIHHRTASSLLDKEPQRKDGEAIIEASDTLQFSALTPPSFLGKGAGGLGSLAELQALMWRTVGLVRDAAGLAEAVATLDVWAETTRQATQQPDLSEAQRRTAAELANLALLGLLMARAALEREESRGGHFRADYPTTRSAWQHHIVQTQPVRVAV